MRLCYLADPISTHTVKWLAYFVRHGYEVHLLGWNHPTDPALSGVCYHHLPDELEQPFVAPVRSALWHLRHCPLMRRRRHRPWRRSAWLWRQPWRWLFLWCSDSSRPGVPDDGDD